MNNKTIQEIIARRRLAEQAQGKQDEDDVDVVDKSSADKKKKKKKQAPTKKKEKETDLSPPKGNKTLSGKPAAEIDTEPTLAPLREAAGDAIVMTFGRMNPPTIGHQVLVDRVQEIANKHGGVARIYLSQTQDPKKNPLHYDHKVTFARQAFGKSVVNAKHVRTFIDAVKDVNKHTKKVVVVVGSDRVEEMRAKLTKMNGSEFHFDSLVVLSAGERDPDADGAAGMSASKLRKLAADGDFEAFKKGLPHKLQGAAKTVYKMVRLEEEARALERELASLHEALNTQQRLKRAIKLRRIKSKIMVGRRRALRRRAVKSVLEKRARRAAIRLFRKRLLRGRKYQDLPLSARKMVDERLAKRKGMIDKLAKRLLPRIQRAEQKRKLGGKFASVTVPGMDTPSQKPAADAKPKTRSEGYVSARPQKLKFTYTVESVEEARKAMEPFNMIWHCVNETIGEKERAALEKKAEAHGIPAEVLEIVYLRGIDEGVERDGLSKEQHAFNRVNSFVSGGKACEADSDLLQYATKESRNVR